HEPHLPSPPLDTEGAEGDGDAPQKAGDKPRAPTKRFTWSADMREVFAQLLENIATMVELGKKMNEYGVVSYKGPTSDVIPKRDLYKKITECFPEGYCNTSAVSREMTKLRKKQQTESGM
ncbi:hypothetical protein P7C73_g4165, partial [Tremellales sp. Uapishka_1]